MQAADSLNTDKEAAGEDRMERTNTKKVKGIVELCNMAYGSYLKLVNFYCYL